MGYIPIFIMLGAFFSLWAAVVFSTFSAYKKRAAGALEERALLPENVWRTKTTAEILTAGRGGEQSAAWSTEYRYRMAIFGYNRLLSKGQYKLFASWYGFKAL